MNKITAIILLLLFFPIFSFAQISAAISVNHSNLKYCAKDTVFFTNSSSGNYVASHWFFGDGSDTWTQNPIHIYDTAKTYTVTLIIFDSLGNSDTAQIKLTINPRPNLILVNDSINQQLIAHVSDPQNTTFKWYFNSTLTSQTDSIVSYYDQGLYSVSATNQYGCTDSASIFISLNNSPYTSSTDSLKIQVQNNILTPNGDGINDVLLIKNTPPNCSVKVYNQWGILVFSKNNYSNFDGFQGNDNKGKPLPQGTYYYIISAPGFKTTTGYIDLIR